MDSYQRFARAPEFRPRSVGNISQLAQQRAQQQQGDLQRFAGQLEQRSQDRIEDTRFVGQDLEALSNFSKTALNLLETNIKQTIKDKEIGAQFDSIYSPTIDVAEVEAIAEGEAQNSVAGAAANMADEQGEEVAAERIQVDLNRIGRGLENEKALLYNARDRYAAEIMQLVNSDQLQELYRVDPQKAIEVATKLFIEKYQLQNTTKANFVEILAPTIRSTNTYVAQNKISEQIKELKSERLAEADRDAARLFSAPDVQQSWNELTEKYVRNNNGINSYSAANARAAEYVLNAAGATGDTSLVEKVGGIFTKPGQKGTEIANTYNKLYMDALDLAQKTSKSNKLKKRAETITELAETLPGLPFEERAERINKAIQSLGNDFEGKQKIQDLYADLQANASNYYNFIQLQKEQVAGKLYTDQELLNRQNAGDLTERQVRSLRTQRDNISKPGREQAKNAARYISSTFKTNFSFNIGAQVDPSGVISAIQRYPVRPVTTKRANDIAKAFNDDLKYDLSQYALTLDYANLPPQEIRDKIQQRADEFYQKQTSQGGKYYLGGLFEQTGPSYITDDNKETFTQIKRAADYFGTVSGERDLSSNITNWSGDWNPSSGWKDLQGKYKKGDIVFDAFETESYLTKVSTGGVPADIAEFAQRNGTTAREFLDQHARYYGKPPVTRITGDNYRKLIPDLGEQKSGFPNQSKYEPVAAALIPIFITEGFTPQGAAMAAAYVRFSAYKQFEKDPKSDLIRNQTSVDFFTTKIPVDLLQLLTNPKITMKEIAYNLSTYGEFGYQDYVSLAKRLQRIVDY